nr:hypothetical protein [Tanacetum cinerariifolium]
MVCVFKHILVDNTKTRRLQPRSNTKNDRVPFVSKSSRSKNKGVKVEEHHRKLLLSKNKKHMSSDCNNVKLSVQNVKSKVVCAMCKQCLNSVNHDVCLLNYVNGMNSRGKKQKANVSINENQKKQKPKVKKTKKVGSIERLASPKPSKSRSFLTWSPTGRMFDLKGKIIASSESESQFDWSKGDNACTCNPLEPTIKRFPNSTFSLAGNSNMFMANILITKVYFIEGLGHNLFLVGQFCDLDLEVAFRRNACFIINLEGVDLLKGDRTTNLYTINLHDMASASPICLMDRTSSTKSKYETPKVIKTFLKRITILLQSPVIIIRTDNDIEFKNQVLKEYFDSVGISHQLSYVRTPQQNGVVKRRNRTVFNRRTKKIMETMNVSLDELSAMAFKQHSEMDLLFKPMYDDYIGGQPSAAPKTILAAQAHQVCQSLTTSTSIADTAPTPTISSSQATIFPNTSQDVNELNSQQQHIQQPGNQAPVQPETVTDNVSNAMFDANTFVNPFATPSTSAAESSSSQNVDPSNMHTFYQPYPHEFQWTKDYPLEQVLGEPSRPVLTRNQLQSDGDICMYALTVSTMEPKNVKEAMTDPAWIESMQEELL